MTNSPWHLKLLKLLLLLAVLYIALCAVLFCFQRSLLYFPQARHRTDLPALELAADGARILVTTKPQDGPDAVLYFGGNAEDVTYSLPMLAEAFPGQALYLMHYRSYGGSSGSPSEPALVADAKLLFDEAFKKHQHITVIGRSLGSGVAVQLASQRPVERLVLVTPFNSALELAEQRLPWLPIRWLFRDKFESWKYAEKVHAPTLLVAAERDEIIPSESTRALYTHFPKGVAAMTVVPGMGHNTIQNSPAYSKALSGAP